MTAREVAEYLNVDPDRVYDLGIPPVAALTPEPDQKKTRSMRWSAAGVLAWLEERRPQAALIANDEWLRDLRESGELLSARQAAAVLAVSRSSLARFDIPHRDEATRHWYPASVLAAWLEERRVTQPADEAVDD